jgi:hypothetical protein
MKKLSLTEGLLSLIAITMVAIAIRSYIQPLPAHAGGGDVYPLYIEPGTQMLRAPDGSKQVYGRVMVDMRNGEVWGFPTNTTDTYPANPLDSKPAVSHPFPLGRFALEDINK